MEVFSPKSSSRMHLMISATNKGIFVHYTVSFHVTLITLSCSIKFLTIFFSFMEVLTLKQPF